MQRKRRDSLPCGNVSPRRRECHVPNGRGTAFFNGARQFVTSAFSPVSGSVVTVVVLFITCTPPPPPGVRTCPEPLWKEYESYQSYRVREEEIKLEALLAAGDTAAEVSGTTVDSTDTAAVQKLSALEIKRRLFELSIHQANPGYDVDKIAGYASFLSRRGGPDSLRYLNWRRAVREHKTLLHERDSLATAISAISQEGKKESRSMESLKKEIKDYQKQRDSLGAVISTQQEMISKLQKLDVLMEQQRNKIQ